MSDRRYTIDFHLSRWHIVLPVFLGYAYAGDGYYAGCQMAGICVDEGLSKLMNGYWENGVVLRLYIQCSSG